MKLLYFKGMQALDSGFDTIKKNFKDEGIDLTLFYNSYMGLPFNKHKLQKSLSERLTSLCGEEEKVSLICHSMGCNFGILLTAFDERVDKLVLISPELVNVPDYEKNNIRKNFPANEEPQLIQSLTLEKAKDISLFLSTQSSAKKSVEKLENDILIIYGIGDIFVSQNYICKLAKKDNVRYAGVPTISHNPLTSSPSKTLSLIKSFVR